MSQSPDQQEEPKTKTQWTGRMVTENEALAGAWWRCSDGGFGWVWDEADVEVAAEYLRAVAHEN